VDCVKFDVISCRILIVNIEIYRFTLEECPFMIRLVRIRNFNLTPTHELIRMRITNPVSTRLHPNLVPNQADDRFVTKKVVSPIRDRKSLHDSTIRAFVSPDQSRLFFAYVISAVNEHKM